MNTTRNQSAFPLSEERVRGSLRRGSLLLVALFATLSLNAQVVEVYKAGNILYSCHDADSVVFRALLKDAFSVSATKQVHFSKGNLQYTQSTQTWSFAEQQYDMVGEANVSGSALADKIDLFGWSGSTGSAKWGIGTSTDYSDYSGDFVDWGANIGDDKTWYTLTNDEWSYLLDERANAAQLNGVARIQLGENKYVNGLVLLPDDWTCPAGVTFKSGFASEYSVQAYADYQTFTIADWQKLEAAGAVFLPASGNRTKSRVRNIQNHGYYWSATPHDVGGARGLYFYPNGADTDYYDNPSRGQAVRLVRNL